ncbi:BadF/BadG/BcrA/BcrD ATPase family protein [Thermanaerothrix sp. 4228-RoL]|uniref:BadF/BadG/BcrA/BcrD ATPase family protein n=2 Tax=Thermanaerothrix TaxID=1077886 RepID=A0ABU3NLR6_9CHLR|nr:BadF/BadG/BcrA/BcrD ATPase family protein [Thermanaerothrix sp. 4228-RoL]MDT8897785.1 BadF/BadG/BcrA/BcrD ATPase family protein [Thermanaerothrix sp. 4228-RoL]
MMDYFLGVDVGSSKTQALVTTADGQVLGLGQAGGGNPDVVGMAAFQQVVAQATQQALAVAGLSLPNLRAAGVGISGFDWPSQRIGFLKALYHVLGPDLPLEIVNDAVLGLLISPRGWGISLVSGTGCNCWGRNPQGDYAHMTGYGDLMGEYAGATELVARAIHFVAYQWTGRGQPTGLTPLFIQKAGAKDLGDLIEGLCRGYYHLGAEAAPLVFECAREGDQVALALLDWAGRELGAMVVTVARRLNMTHLAPDIILIGSMFKNQPALADFVRPVVLEAMPKARLLPLPTLPVVGAVVLAMEVVRIPRNRIQQALENLQQTVISFQ